MEEIDEAATSQTPDFSSAAPTDVECDACVGRKRKAEQACLECVASYCEPHLEVHNSLHGGKRHRLVEATERLQERTCPEHGKLLEVFCRTDQKCICYLCVTDTHRTHDVIAIEVEMAEEKSQLDTLQKRTSERIQTRVKAEENLRQAIEAFKTSAEEAVWKNDRFFTELICCMKKMQHSLNNRILAQKEAVIKEAEELREKMLENIRELWRRHDEIQNLKQLSQEHNHIRFLQSNYSISALKNIIRLPVLLVHPNCSFGPTTDALSELMKKVKLICKWRFITISERDATKLTLDPNTLHDYIHLSANATLLTAVRESEFYQTHSERFERRLQALCKEGLRGSPRYWEVKCGTRGLWVSIAISYKGIRRSGQKAPLFGRCPSSWALRSYRHLCEFWHNDKETRVRNSSTLTRIGVYLDHSAGILAFYNVSVQDHISLIHKVQTRFTEPVYAGFGLTGIGSQIQLCALDSQN